MFHAAKHIGGRVLWVNLHLVFWLSLMPFVSGLLGENGVSTLTVGVYGFDPLMCALAYTLFALWPSMKKNQPLHVRLALI